MFPEPFPRSLEAPLSQEPFSKLPFWGLCQLLTSPKVWQKFFSPRLLPELSLRIFSLPSFSWTIQMWPGTIPFTVSRTSNPDARQSYYGCGVKGFNVPVRRARISGLLHESVMRISSFRRGSAGAWMTDRISGRSGTPMQAPGDRPAFQRPVHRGDKAQASWQLPTTMRESCQVADR